MTTYEIKTEEGVLRLLNTSREEALRHPLRTPRSRVIELVRCPGEAHLPEVAGNIDNCLTCAPRWGWVPA